ISKEFPIFLNLWNICFFVRARDILESRTKIRLSRISIALTKKHIFHQLRNIGNSLLIYLPGLPKSTDTREGIQRMLFTDFDL
ncbi:MAG: hypothetical protein K2K32_04505, partial [Muribaculaceae bacterium]|nr:hypothetical protein [Muribaculaceae bacterium]